MAATQKLAGWPLNWVLFTGCETIFGALCALVRNWLKKAHRPSVKS